MNLPVLGKNTPPASDGSTRNKKNGSFRKKLLRKRVIFPAVACILVAAAAVRFLGGGQTAAAAGQSYVTAAAERRDITAQITGSGTLEAANSYSVTTFVEGTILTADFEEGDQVEAGTVLYTIDDSDMSSTLEQAEISLNQSQRNYDNKLEELENLTLTAPKAGRVLSLDVEVGDEVSAGQTVATVRNSDTMCLELPFLADEAASFFVGQSASVTLDSTFETLTGTVTKISGNNEVLTGNVIVRNVTIEVSNPGGLSTTQTGSASIGGVDSAGSGSFTYEAEKAVTAQVSGEVSQIYVSEGSWVDQNAPILTLTSDALEDEIQSASESLRNAQLSLDSRYDQLDDYTVTSPIQGTIIDKNYNAGENAEANQVLCTIYDLSYLTMTLSVDELDISSIAVGQQVSVTADAVEGTVYQGVVTKVSVAGTSSGSATTYPVTIRIDETDGLLPGMNVDASITLNSAEDVLAIPSAALNRGNTVLVTADSPSAANGTLSEVTGTEGEEYYSVTVEVGTSDSSYTVTNGEVDYASLVSAETKGPYISTDGSLSLPFSLNGATVYRNDTLSSPSQVEAYDVYYYNEGMGTVWVYHNRASGTLTALSPSKVSPTSATVAGVTYEIGTSQAAYQLSSQGQFQEGDLVTLLLGMNGEIVEVLDPQDSESTYYGSVVSSVKGSSTSSTSSSSTASAQVTTQVACTDGILRTFYHSGSAFEAGRLVTVTVSQSGTVKGMSVNHLEGTVSADGGTLGKYTLASDVEILDTDEEGGYVRIYPSRLAGAKLSGDDVRYYTLNASGEIDRLILNEVTGDTYQYVYLSGITDSSSSGNGNIDNISVSYTYVLDGQTHSLSGSARYSAKVGGAVLQYEDGNLTSIIQLSGVTLDSLGSLSAMSGNQEYPLSEDVQVLLRDGTGIYAYYAASLSQINTEDYDLTGWYDDLGCAAGGRIRIITAVPK